MEPAIYATITTIDEESRYVVSRGGEPHLGKQCKKFFFRQEFKLKCRATTYEYAGQIKIVTLQGEYLSLVAESQNGFIEQANLPLRISSTHSGSTLSRTPPPKTVGQPMHVHASVSRARLLKIV
jgi:hypothetical protein